MGKEKVMGKEKGSDIYTPSDGSQEKHPDGSRIIQVAQVDAFTNQLFGGNPAGVVWKGAEQLSEEEMQQVAREMNLSETAFVLPSENGDFRLRYFTPESEINFCGHATVGTLYALARHEQFRMQDVGDHAFTVETNVGILPMSVHRQENDAVTISFRAPEIDLQPSKFRPEQIATALRVDKDLIDPTKPIMREQTNNIVYVATKSLKDLGSITYDYQRAKAFSEKHDIIVFCFLTPETFDRNNHVHSRVFAPAVGLVEDPPTGATQGGLAAYLIHNRMVPSDTRVINSEQGHFVKRPGQLQIYVKKEHGKLAADIHARAVLVFLTEIKLPANRK